MSYVVLARKWRPQTFADLTGQDHVTRTLTNAIEQDRVPHAMLFTGARGVGKTSSARIVAMALNCARGPTPSPCGECDSCREVQRGASVDVFEIDGASNRGINEIRDLRDGVRYAPNRDRYKIYIIDEVHMLTTEAFNALLKTLEEPPPHVIFIFATTEAHKIPITILSRCQRFDFRRIPYREIVGRLRHIVDAEHIAVPDDVLGLIARQAGGGMRDALSRLDQVIAFCGDQVSLDAAAAVLGVAERQRLFEISEAIIARDVEAALRVLDQVASYGVDIGQFAAALVGHLRDLTVVAVSRDAAELTALTDAELALARQQVARIDAGTLHRLFELALQAADDASRSAHARLVLEMALVRMIAVEPVHSLMSLIKQLERIAEGEGPLPPPSGAVPPSGPAAPPATPAAPTPASAAQAMPADPQPASARPTAATGAQLPAQRQESPDDGAAATAGVPAQSGAGDPVREDAEGAGAEEPQQPALLELEAPRADALPSHIVEPEPPMESEAFGLTEFRRAVDVLRKASPAIGSLLAEGTVVGLGHGEITLALGKGLEVLWNEAHAAAWRDTLQQLGLPEHQIRIVRSIDVDDSELQDGYQLKREQRREREEFEEQAERRLREHPATARILGRWPGARIIEVQIAESDWSEESTA